MTEIEPQHHSPTATKEKKMPGKSTNRTDPVQSADRAPGAASAEDVASLYEANGPANRRAWWLSRFTGEQLYMAAWMTALLASVLGVG